MTKDNSRRANRGRKKVSGTDGDLDGERDSESRELKYRVLKILKYFQGDYSSDIRGASKIIEKTYSDYCSGILDRITFQNKVSSIIQGLKSKKPAHDPENRDNIEHFIKYIDELFGGEKFN